MDDLHLDDLRIDSLVDLIRASFFLEEWSKMLQISDKLLLSANKVYLKQKKALEAGKRYVFDDRKRHIVYYLGYSHMSKGIALYNMKRFEESKECTVLMTILVAAINHGFQVDSVFDHFKGKIGEAIETCSKSGEAIYITKFFYTLFSYHLKTKPHQVALHNILQSIEASDNYKDVSQYKVSVSVEDIIAACSYNGPK